MEISTLIYGAIFAYIIFMFITSSPIAGSLFMGIVVTSVFVQMYDQWPLDMIGVHLRGNMELWNFAVFPVVFYLIGNYFHEKSKKNEEKRRHETIVDSYNCPVEIVSFSSMNNIFTAGNNSIQFKARNNSDYAQLFTIDLFVNGNWRPSAYSEFEIGAKEIKTFNILGPAWRKAKDIRIASCR